MAPRGFYHANTPGKIRACLMTCVYHHSTFTEHFPDSISGQIYCKSTDNPSQPIADTVASSWIPCTSYHQSLDVLLLVLYVALPFPPFLPCSPPLPFSLCCYYCLFTILLCLFPHFHRQFLYSPISLLLFPTNTNFPSTLLLPPFFPSPILPPALYSFPHTLSYLLATPFPYTPQPSIPTCIPFSNTHFSSTTTTET